MIRTRIGPSAGVPVAKNRLARILLMAAIPASPVAIISVLIYAYFGATIFDFTPDTPLNDEVYYWHQALTFSKVGFAGGYYTYEELAPGSARLVRFGGWGPAYPMLYGSLGFLLGGFRPYSPILINIILVTLAIAIFIRLVRPGLTQLIFLEVLCVTWWPFWYYLPAATATSLNLAIAMVVAGVFYKLIGDREHFTGLSRHISLGLLLLASFEIPYWSLMAFPFFMLGTDLTKKKNIGLALSKAALLVILAFVFESFFYSPYPYNSSAVNSIIEGAKRSPLAGLRALALRIGMNTVDYRLFLFSNQYGEDVWLKGLVAVQLLATLFVAALVGLHVFRQARRGSLNSNTSLHREVVFHVFSLSYIWALATCLYVVVIVRHFAPFLLITFLLFIAFKHFRATPAIILSNLLVTGYFLSSFSQWRSTAFDVKGHQNRESAGLGAFLVYQPEQDPWCNTVLSTAAPFTYAEVSAVPAGIGYSASLVPGLLKMPMQSKYILMDPVRPLPVAQLDLKLLGTTTLGNLYLNPRVPCR